MPNFMDAFNNKHDTCRTVSLPCAKTVKKAFLIDVGIFADRLLFFNYLGIGILYDFFSYRVCNYQIIIIKSELISKLKLFKCISCHFRAFFCHLGSFFEAEIFINFYNYFSSRI